MKQPSTMDCFIGNADRSIEQPRGSSDTIVGCPFGSLTRQTHVYCCMGPLALKVTRVFSYFAFAFDPQIT